jgi:hypothetical protein
MTVRLVGLIRRLTICYVCGCVGIRIVKKMNDVFSVLWVLLNPLNVIINRKYSRRFEEAKF